MQGRFMIYLNKLIFFKKSKTFQFLKIFLFLTFFKNVNLIKIYKFLGFKSSFWYQLNSLLFPVEYKM